MTSSLFIPDRQFDAFSCSTGLSIDIRATDVLAMHNLWSILKKRRPLQGKKIAEVRYLQPTLTPDSSRDHQGQKKKNYTPGKDARKRVVLLTPPDGGNGLPLPYR
jgi:hypothetical protein